jgi:hypothetical protein
LFRSDPGKSELVKEALLAGEPASGVKAEGGGAGECEKDPNPCEMSGDEVQLLTEDVPEQSVGSGPEESSQGIKNQKVHGRYRGRSGKGSCDGIKAENKFGHKEGPHTMPRK